MVENSLESSSEMSLLKHKQAWSLRRKLVFGGVVLLVVVLAVGLGVGLGLGLNQGSDDDGSGSVPTSTPTSSSVPKNISSDGIWQPTVGMSWQYELYHGLNTTATDNIQVWDIDVFDNNVTIIQGLQDGGARVICYFSAGSYENWRPDKSSFQSSDLGKDLDGWPGEKWLNVSSENVRNIMLSRLDIAVGKGCDGVDPDNVDGYDNDNGLGLTQADAINYVTFLAEAAQARNLSIGLKNAGAIIPNVIDLMQWSVNEQCEQFDECSTYAAFIEQGKPVFHVEYPKGSDTNNNDTVSSNTFTTICSNTAAKGFSTIIKNMNLDSWLESC